MIKKPITTLFNYKTLYPKYEHYYYRNILKMYDKPETYSGLVDLCLNKKEVLTSKEIYFSSNLKFNYTIKKAKKNIFSKRVTIKKIENTTILLHKTRIGGYPAKLVMHFYQNNLFLFNYTFSNLSNNDKSIIKNVLKEKYLNNNTQFSFSKNRIVDSLGNHIFIEDDVYFTINYISLTDDFFKMLNNIKEELEIKKKVRKELHKKELYNNL
ncbi:hypothetical protein [Polaribacter sargassicola]|uniref:hypothetical protein n=1 Tax=Polaribacter sargassicola TaxID=2836891 RepID=UPI001F42CD68|nr:hypothetical protein [Polaribacter sp. DS7-9]MCG1036858.1 hypothetical protein [Polaribacter sp. DS7-9]